MSAEGKTMWRPPRAGQAIPAGYMPPPERLGPRGARIWEEIQRSMPNVFAECDRIALLAYCVLASTLEAYLEGEAELTEDQFDKLHRRFLSQARGLRISPQARSASDAMVAPRAGDAGMAPTNGGDAIAPWTRGA